MSSIKKKPNKKVFFINQKVNSRLKSYIVSDYFWAWAKILVGKLSPKAYLQFLDLFAGAGRYEDENASTPLLILEHVINDVDLRAKVKLVFNEADYVIYNKLKAEIEGFPGVSTLTYAPQILNESVGGGKIEELLLSSTLMPTLLFADPWGYRGLTMDLFSHILKKWGCEIIFFFNYSRINAAINNKKVTAHINSLFGQNRADRLRRDFVRTNQEEKGDIWFERITPEEREQIVVVNIDAAFREALSPRNVFTQKFRFTNGRGNRTSHYLIFATKEPFALRVMKDIMAKQSTSNEQGVASFESSPLHKQLSLGLTTEISPLEKLIELLRRDFVARTLTVTELWNEHHIRTFNASTHRFTLPNYKQALLLMEERSIVKILPHRDKRPSPLGKPTLADDCSIIFG